MQIDKTIITFYHRFAKSLYAIYLNISVENICTCRRSNPNSPVKLELKFVPMHGTMNVSCVQSKAAVGGVLQVGEDDEGGVHEGSHAVLPPSYSGR